MARLYATLLFLLLSAPLITNAQTEFSSFEIPVKSFSVVMPTVSTSQEIHLLGFTDSEVHSMFIDTDGKLSSYGSYPRVTFGKNLIGSIGLPGKFLYFNQEGLDLELIRPYKVVKGSADIKALEPLVLPLDEKSKFVQAYTHDSRLFLLYFSKETQMLQLFEFSDEAAFTEKKFPVTVPKMYDRLVKGDKPVFVNKENEQSIFTGNSQKKIYHEQGKVYIIFDSFGASRSNVTTLTTEILTLDLASNKAEFTSLPPAHKIRPIDMNSYLHNGTLYRLIITTGFDLQLTATAIASNTSTVQYLYLKDEPLAIKATPVYRSVPQKFGKEDKAIVEPTKDVVKKLGAGVATIVAQDVADNTLMLTIGSYRLLQQSAVPPVGGALLSAIGPAAIPAALALGAAGVATTSQSEEISYFNIYLSKDNLTSTAPVEQTSYHTLVADFENSLAEQKVAFGAAFAYPYQGKLHYGYLNRKTKLFRIMTISRN